MVKRAPIETYCEKKISTLQKNAIGMIDYVDISSVDNTKKKIISFQTMNTKDAPSRAKQLLKKDDIIVSTVRPNLNAVAVVESETDNLMVGSTGYCVLRCKDNMDFRYLFNFCQSQYFIDDMSSQATGASYPAVSTTIVRSSLIPCYPVDEQRKIASELDKITDLIDRRKEQLEKLDELVKARFVELFGDPEKNTFSWKEEELSKHLTVIGGYAFKSEQFSEEGIPVLRIGNINAGFFKPVNLVYWEDDDALNRYKMYPGDLVMSLTGTVGKDDYGNVCILGNDYDVYYLNQRNAKLELQDTINKYYLSMLLKFEPVKKKLTGISRGVRQANISNKDILNLPVPIPPIELQNQFTAFVEQTDKSKYYSAIIYRKSGEPYCQSEKRSICIYKIFSRCSIWFPITYRIG